MWSEMTAAVFARLYWTQFYTYSKKTKELNYSKAIKSTHRNSIYMDPRSSTHIQNS